MAPSRGTTSESRAFQKVVVTLTAWRTATLLMLAGIGLLLLSANLEGPRGPSALDTTIREVGPFFSLRELYPCSGIFVGGAR